MVQALIDGLACLNVGADGDELHRVLLERLIVEDVVLVGHYVVGELGVEVVAGGEQRAHATVAAVAGKALVVADGPPHLPRLHVTAESRPCRHADEAVGPDVVLHHDVDDAGGKQAAHGTTLQNQSLFHFLIFS